MSILLEALRQKSRNDSETLRHDAPALTLSTDIPAKSEHLDNKGDDDHGLTLESLLEPLKIQPPQHLDWQLSAADTHKQEVVTDDPLEAAHAFEHQALELLFPVADDHLMVTEQVTEAPTSIEVEGPAFIDAEKTNSAASASSYLNLLNKKTPPEKPVLVKKVRLQKPSLSTRFLIGALLVTTASGIGYYGYSLWETDQAELINQMARYEAPIQLPINNTDNQPATEAAADANVLPDGQQRIDSAGLPAPLLGASNNQMAIVNEATQQPVVSEPKKHRQTVDPVYSPRQETITVTKGVAISTLLNSAWNSWHQGDVVTAEQTYRQVLERQPNNRDALMGMFAITQLQPASAAQSQDIAERLIDLYPQDEEVKTLISSVLNVTGASDEKTESALKNQLQQTPNNATIHYQLGVLYTNAKRWNDAQSAFFKAVSLDVGQPEYLANLAIAYDQLGKVDLAISGYQRALEAARARPTSLNQDALLARLQFLSLQASNGE